MSGLTARRLPKSSGRALFNIFVYYGALVAVLALLFWRFPEMVAILAGQESPGVSASDEITQTFMGTAIQQPAASGLTSVWVTTVALLGTVLVMIPSTWAYILIKRETGYEESVVHTLLILPIVVAGVVIIVKSNIALAFSLAGIVAAVRFRTTLDDTKDAVYVFMAIGVGLAAGVTRLYVAVALSLVFNVVNLILWRFDLGNPYADQIHRTGGLGLGTAIAGPASNRDAVGFGDRKAMDAGAPSSLDEVAQAQARMRQYLKEESETTKERKRYTALLVYTRDPGKVQDLVEPVLETWTLRWQLAEVVPGEKGVSAMTYLVRLKDDTTESLLVRSLEDADKGSGVLQAAELRSLKELAKST